MAARTELVELVEDDEPGRGAPDASDGDAPAPRDTVDRSRAWMRRHWRWLVPSVVALVAVLVGTQAVADARERSRLDRLAAVPGVLAPVSSHLHVLWRGQQDVATVVQQGAWVDGMFIGGLAGTDGTLKLVALDDHTGKRVWTTPVQAPDRVAAPDPATQQTYTGCFVVPRDGAETLRRPTADWVLSSTALHADKVLAACVAQQVGQEVDGPSDVSLWVVDPSTGAVLSHRVLPGATQVTLLGNDLVAADPVGQTWHVAVSDLATGDPAWTFDTAAETAPARPDPNSFGPDTPPQLVPTRDGGLLVVTAGGHVTRLDSRGHVTATSSVPASSYVTQTRAGALLTSRYTSGTTEGTLQLADGRTTSITGGPLYLAVDDGSAPDVVLLSEGGPPGSSNEAAGVSARSATSGRTLWTRPGAVQGSLLLGGTLYLAGVDTIAAVDARTGAERWTKSIDFSPQTIGTDGTSLLVAEPSTKLTAYALRTGVQEWTQRLGTQVAGNQPAWTVQNLDLAAGKRLVLGLMDDGTLVVLG